MRIVLLLIGLILSADGLYYGAVTGMGAGEAAVVAMGIIFILWATFYEAFKEKGFLKFLKYLFSIIMALFVVYSAAVCVIGKMDTATGREDYVIVLGAGLNGSEPSAVLQSRLDKAIEFMDKNSSATAVVSGGQGQGETISEAEAMSDYMVLHGISDDRIILENTSSSTYENFENSKAAVEDGSVVFITNEFHVFRASQMAIMNGISATHISADTPVTMLPVSCAREMIAQAMSFRYYLNE
jgi:uncharacterized SAM-binding protein YcdF (DUF218 family)